MTQPKPIIQTTGKCRICYGIGNYVDDDDYLENTEAPITICTSCKGTGEQTTEIYALRDFEKCEQKWHNRFNGVYGTVKCQECGFMRYKIGYKIPFKDYEIKSITALMFINKEFEYANRFYKFTEKHNLKEDDRLVIRTK